MKNEEREESDANRTSNASANASLKVFRRCTYETSEL